MIFCEEKIQERAESATSLSAMPYSKYNLFFAGHGDTVSPQGLFFSASTQNININTLIVAAIQ